MGSFVPMSDDLLMKVFLFVAFSDDIFADTTTAAPKAKKETKKKAAVANSTPADSDNIFDDPLNLGGK